jgi:hypothetical protein
VLGDGGEADRQLAGTLADGAGPLGQPLDVRAPGRITERRPSVYRWIHSR